MQKYHDEPKQYKGYLKSALGMTMKNKYAKRARISAAKIREVVHYFAIDLTALQAAALSGLNRNTVNRLYRALRERMLLACEAQRPLFGVVEVDESFFGARRVKGRRGRGAYGKTVVFGIFERHGHVYTEIVSDCSKPTLQGIIRGRVDARTVITPMAGAATTAWSISGMATSASIMVRTSLPREPSTSMASKASGGWPRSGWQSLKASPDTPSICTSKKPNGDTIIARLTSIRPCYSTCAKTLSARQDPKLFTSF